MKFKALLVSALLAFSTISSFATVNWKEFNVPDNQSGATFFYDPESITSKTDGGSKLGIGWFMVSFSKPIPLSQNNNIPVQSQVIRIIMDCESGMYINSYLMFFSEKLPDGTHQPVFVHEFVAEDGTHTTNKTSVSYILLCGNK